MRKSVSFCRLQANQSKETPFLDLPYHLFLHNPPHERTHCSKLQWPLSCLVAQLWRNLDIRSMGKPYPSFIGISLMAVPFCLLILFLQNECKMMNTFHFHEMRMRWIPQSQNFREVSHFISAPIFSSTWSFLWHQSLSCRCKGMATGFGNKRSSLRFSEKSPHRWVVFIPKNLVFPASLPLKSTWNETTDATGRRKKNVGKGSDKKVKKRELPFSSWNRK